MCLCSSYSGVTASVPSTRGAGVFIGNCCIFMLHVTTTLTVEMRGVRLISLAEGGLRDTHGSPGREPPETWFLYVPPFKYLNQHCWQEEQGQAGKVTQSCRRIAQQGMLTSARSPCLALPSQIQASGQMPWGPALCRGFVSPVLQKRGLQKDPLYC